MKDARHPLVIYRKSPVIVCLYSWLPVRGQLLRHHKFYKPRPLSLGRIERIAQTLVKRISQSDETIEGYYIPSAEPIAPADAPPAVSAKSEDSARG